MGKEEKIKRGQELRDAGYNCAQSVLIPFAGELGFTEQQLAILASGLGAGAGVGELCGVANALAISEGMLASDSGPAGKKKAMPGARRQCDAFSKPYGGCMSCRELKGKFGKGCDELVKEGIELLYSRIEPES